jgi:hypothetical protein
LVAVCGVLIVATVVRLCFTARHDASAQELTELALHAGSAEDQEQAATRLEVLAGKSPHTGTRNPVQPFLGRLLNESENPGVRSASMRGLASIWDYECVPKMLDLLMDPSPQVARTAAQAIGRLISVEAKLDTNAATKDRAAQVQQIREQWQVFDKTHRVPWQRRLEEKDAKP